ncbi:MAG: cysteine desulfurase NifS [Clostridiales bacterium]|nr:cysteine desulfurase NifS [Clostridiales bacterium]
MEERFVYADNAATTSTSPEVLEAMMPYFKDGYGNPSSLHKKGREAKAAITEAREKIASLLGAAKPNEIYFTASGSEADNWAIKGAAHANQNRGKHIISTKIEHHAVLHSLEALEKEGFEVTYLDVDSDGLVTPEAVVNAMRDDTTLVEVMFANNEVGTIEPIKEIAAAVKAKNPKTLVFTDAVQAVGNVPINVAELGVDMLSLSGHKIHTPKGIGALYIKTGVRILNLVDGGGQERGKRGGTENVAYIVGLAKALEVAVNGMDENKRVEKMRDRLIDGILTSIPHSRLNGSRTTRLVGNVNISFEFIEGESLLLLLDMAGICASTGSACSSTSLEPSHVLISIGVPVELAHGSLRLSISRQNTDEDVDYILEKLPGIVQRLREMSPLYEEYLKNNVK